MVGCYMSMKDLFALYLSDHWQIYRILATLFLEVTPAQDR